MVGDMFPLGNVVVHIKLTLMNVTPLGIHLLSLLPDNLCTDSQFIPPHGPVPNKTVKA